MLRAYKVRTLQALGISLYQEHGSARGTTSRSSPTVAFVQVGQAAFLEPARLVVVDEAGFRRRAAVRACRESAWRDAVDRGSRFKTSSRMREYLRLGFLAPLWPLR